MAEVAHEFARWTDDRIDALIQEAMAWLDGLTADQVADEMARSECSADAAVLLLARRQARVAMERVMAPNGNGRRPEPRADLGRDPSP